MRPGDAERLLNDRDFKELQQLARERIHKLWENQPDKEEREKLWLQLDCIRLYHLVLQQILNEEKRQS